MGDGLLFHLGCLLACITLVIGYNIQNVNKHDVVEQTRERRGDHQHRSRRASRYRNVILEEIGWDISAKHHHGYYHPSISINVTFQTSRAGDNIKGRGLWKIGLFRSLYRDGFGDRAGPYVYQLLSDEEASMGVRTGRPYHFTNLQTVYDLNEVGCDVEFHHLCMEFTQGDSPSPWYNLTIVSITGSAVLCTEIPCFGRTGPGVDRRCRLPCPEDEPVCGNDGITYPSSCEVDNLIRCLSRDVTIAYYGECRIGVIMESMFWSASVVDNEPGELTELEMEAFLFANESSESVAGTNLWRMGVFGSMNVDGTGPKFGYVPQILDETAASQVLVSGLPLPIRARFHFDVATIGCNEFDFMCMEFTRDNAAEPFFPFQTNSGKDTFTSCRVAPCDPLASLNRMAVGPVTWGITVATFRRSAPSDIVLDVLVQITPDSELIQGNGLWRIGLFGSPLANGSSSERFNYVRQLLDPALASLPITPGQKINFPALPAQFKIIELGCSRYKYICLEIAKGDEPQPDFVFHNDQQKPLIFCKSVSCPGPPKPVVRLLSLDWNLGLITHRIGSPSNVSIIVSIATSERSSPVNGTDLWKLGFFTSGDANGVGGRRGQYKEQILSQADSSHPIIPGMPLNFVNVLTSIDITGMGCAGSNFSYTCISFAKGDAADPDFDLPLRNDEAVSCKRIACQAVSVNVANYRSMRASYGVESAPGERAVPIRVNLMVTPGDSTKTITGNRLWKVSAFGSASSDGSGSRRSEIPNILDSESQRVSMRPSQEMTLSGDVGLPLAEHVGCRPGYEYLCLEFARGDNPTMTFSMNSNVMCRQMDCQPVGDTSRRPNTGNTGSTGHTSNTGSSGNTGNAADTARWQRMGANLQGLGSDTIGASLEIHPHDTTSRITGSDLWRVGAFGSSNREGTGSRKGQIRNILDDRAMRTSMVPRRPITLSGDIGTPLSRRLGCLRGYEYLCLEFDKGDRPSMPFNMESGIMCQEMPSINCDTSDTGHEVESGTVARWSQIAPGYRRNRNRVTATVDVTPHPDTDLIHGNNLWRVGVFGSERSDGSGRRNGEVRDILDYSGRGRTLQPPRGSNQNIIELSGSFNFPDGCTRGYRYLCIEFDKSENPSMDFSMSRPDPGCMEQQCDGPRVDPGGSGTSGGSGGSHTGSSGGSHGDTSVEITGLSWAPVRSRGSNFFDSAEATVNLNFEPGPTFEGSNLWRMGVFASPDSEGQTDRQDETEQILSSADRSRTIQQRRGNTFQISNPRVNISDAGCEGKIYLCFEFGQARNPNPSFSISGPHGNGQTRISCKRQTCRITKSVYVMKVTPTSSNPQIVAQDDNDVRFNVEVRFDRPRTMSITGTDLWRMEAWASNSNRASGRKLSHSTQILNSDFVRDTVVTKGTDSSRIGDFSFTNLEHRIDMRPDVTCKQVKFLCVKLHKDNPHPDFELQVRDNNPDFLMGCLKLQCEGVNMTADLLSTSSPSRGIVHPTSLPSLHPSPIPSNQTAASEKMFVVNNIGISREVNSAVQSGRNNDMLLNLNVVHDRGTSTEVTGQPGWAVQAWGSSKKNGKKAKISPANLNLGAERQQNFDRRTPVRFNRIPYTLDLNDGCQNVKYLCVKLSKTGPGFTLKGRPNSKALTSCTALTCMGDQGSTPSRDTGRGQGAGQAAERPRVEWESLATNMNYPLTTGEVKVTMDATMGFTANSGVPSGPGLWHMAVYGSREDSDSTHDKFGYTGNVLTPKQAKTRIAPGRSTTISGISFRMDMSRIMES
ncbi:uncharacterized protein LOC121412045 [Lytechinus variegatus]|uniref:uncharacterized protein LOC121412045 n=1 Tax=Lytechinus variegatus TaxID=7654 RepID=UPI001BB1D3A6|nr:uncharacterized protein LOC121412045 [Lytechinus variegatus]